MRQFGAFVLVFLEAQIKSTCISHNSFCIFSMKQCLTIIELGFCHIRNNQSLGKCNQPRPPVSANYTCLDLDYSGYHKNLIQLLFIIQKPKRKIYLDITNYNLNTRKKINVDCRSFLFSSRSTIYCLSFAERNSRAEKQGKKKTLG